MVPRPPRRQPPTQGLPPSEQPHRARATSRWRIRPRCLLQLRTLRALLPGLPHRSPRQGRPGVGTWCRSQRPWWRARRPWRTRTEQPRVGQQWGRSGSLRWRQRTIPRDQRRRRVHPWRSLPASFQQRWQETCQGAECGRLGATEAPGMVQSDHHLRPGRSPRQHRRGSDPAPDRVAHHPQVQGHQDAGRRRL